MFVRMTILGGLLGLLVLLLRRPLRRRMPARALVVLWDIVLARFLIPADIPVPWLHARSAAEAQIPGLAGGGSSADPQTGTLWGWIWAAGAAAAAVLFLRAWHRENMSVRAAVRLPEAAQQKLHALLPKDLRYPVYTARLIACPAATGIIRKRIILPEVCTSWDAETLRCVLTHEALHLRWCDPLHKLAASCAVILHWFNPVSWMAFILLGDDLELACDESTILALGEESRAMYLHSLLHLAEQRHVLLVGLAGFGHRTTKERIICLMTKKHITLVVIVATALVITAAMTVFAGEAPAVPDAVRETSTTVTCETSSSGEVSVVTAANADGSVTADYQIDEETGTITGPDGTVCGNIGDDGTTLFFDAETTEITVDPDTGLVTGPDGTVYGQLGEDGKYSFTLEDGDGPVEVTVTVSETDENGAAVCSVTGRPSGEEQG